MANDEWTLRLKGSSAESLVGVEPLCRVKTLKIRILALQSNLYRSICLGWPQGHRKAREC